MIRSKSIAFYAPIKPPHHPIPSGDRLIARNLIGAIRRSGHSFELASSYIGYSKRSDPNILDERKVGALQEAARIIDDYRLRSAGELPDVWLTYHPYCKAPDWIGPLVSSEFSIPYLTVEAARTRQGDETDPWKPWREEAEAGIRQADLHLVFKPTDRAFLEAMLGSGETLRDFPTFIDLDKLTSTEKHSLPEYWSADTPVLITAGMMRKGKKDNNFYMLAEALGGIRDKDWNLVIVGGGPEEAQIREAFSSIANERIHWTGQIEHADVLKWMRAADIFVWPGWHEPIGMVYLEAQSQGLPVVAFNSMGVPLVVKDGVTGLLAAENDITALGGSVAKLVDDSVLREALGKKARQLVKKNHSLEAAARKFNDIIGEIS